MSAEALYSVGIALIIAGMAILMVAILLLFFSNTGRREKTKVGGVIVIGPFPIVFGPDKKSVKTLLLLSLLLTILLIILMVVFYFLFR